MATLAVTLEEAQKCVDILRDRQTELVALIDDAATAARHGDDSAADMTKLATEKRAVDLKLAAAENELAITQRQFTEVTAAEQRKRFDAIVIELRERKLTFTEQLRESCLQLGAIIRLRGEAGELARSQMRTAGPLAQRITYPDPFVVSALEEMDKPLPAAGDFCAGAGPDVLLPDLHTGWRTEVKICPLHPKGEK